MRPYYYFFVFSWLTLINISCTEKSIVGTYNSIIPLPDEINYEILGQGKLVFMRGFKCCVIDIDEKHSWELGASLNSGPVVSPNGKMIAYRESVYNGWEENAIVTHIMDIDGTNSKNISSPPGTEFHPSWTHNSAKVLFLKFDYLYGNRCNLYRQSPEPDPPDRVLVKGFIINEYIKGPFSVAPNGKIVFVYNEYICTMNSNGSNLDSLTHEPVPTLKLFSPAWSPDGNKIAYFSVNGDTFEIIVMDAYGKDPVIILSFKGSMYYQIIDRWNDVSLCWSPDGSKIAFNKRENADNTHIYLMKNDGTDITQVTNKGGVSDISLSWSN